MDLPAGPDRRGVVLDATVRLVTERGVDAIRLADVAEAAGVSIGLISHHFRNREGLLAAAFRHESERIARAREPSLDGMSPLKRVVHHIWLRTPAGSASAATPFPVWSFWLDFWALAGHQPDVRAEFESVYDTVTAPLRAALGDGIAAGDFSPSSTVPDLAHRITAMTDGIALRTLLGGIRAEDMLGLLIDGLCLELELDTDSARRARQFARRLGRNAPTG